MFQRFNHIVIAVCCFFTNTFLFSQEYRNSGFIQPMNVPFNLAGSFGEPRKDHFHSGIDIKTNGVEGEPVFAIGDGYISRIKVSPYGYGKVIYITHTNGFTSVYGHLSTFYGAIEKYIHTQHYLQKKSELEVYLDAKKFPVKQGDTIAFSGNTGGSAAPHLHFEIRNTKTEHALNPLDFYPRNFYVDTIAPQINKVKINAGDKFYYSNSRIATFKKEENYNSIIDTINIENDSVVCFSLEGFDKQDDSKNKNGIKKLEVFQNDNLVFIYDLTKIDFGQTRICNIFIDYHEMMNDNGYFYNCYKLKNNTLDYYKIGNGFFKLKKGNNVFEITCFDYNDNTTKNLLFITRHETDSITADTINHVPTIVSKGINIQKIDSIKNKIFKIKFEQNTFYDLIYLDVEQRNDRLYKVGNSNTNQLIPLHKPAKIEFTSSIKKNRNKVVIVRQDHKGKETALKTTFDKSKFYAETKELGSFYLKYDTTKPEIILDSIGNSIISKITDNLSGIHTYNGYIDDKWVNFYYDAKNDLLQYNFDEYCSKGEHLLKIIVTDNVGNKSMVQQKFNYQ